MDNNKNAGLTTYCTHTHTQYLPLSLSLIIMPSGQNSLNHGH